MCVFPHVKQEQPENIIFFHSAQLFSVSLSLSAVTHSEKLPVLMIRKCIAAEFILEERKERGNDIWLSAVPCG